MTSSSIRDHHLTNLALDIQVSLLAKVIQIIRYQSMRTRCSLNVVQIPPTLAKVRRGVKMKLKGAIFQEDMLRLQVEINTIKESQEVYQGNPHLPCIILYFMAIVTLLQILG